ncbi:MAG TPA: DMT family transporter [candidate division WOR-3 bacterium]|uniref:DMT family transporter n=1 Tax=candidate division WOR-3 bacterium TaxID=2052148 RepID=A0A7C0Z9G8_UNCW3|nr:DMT family transporter [candidate division WOR-3 bacterium]
MEREKKSVGYAFTAVFLWSTVATAFKIALKSLNYIQFLFIATLVATLFLFIAFLFTKYKPELKDIMISSLLGFLNPFLYYLVLFKAYSLLPAQSAMTLNYTWPLFIVFFSFLILKQKPTILEIIGLLLGFCGAGIIATMGRPASITGTISIPGIILALLSAVIWGIYWILNMKRNIPEVPGIFLNFLWGTVFIFILVFLKKQFPVTGIKGYLSSMYVGLFEMGITFILWLKALNLSKRTAIVSNLIYLTPFFSLLIISLILKEKISPWTVLGLTFTVLGIIITRIKKN